MLPEIGVAFYQCNPKVIEASGRLPLFQQHRVSVKRQVYTYGHGITAPTDTDLRWIKDNGLTLIADGDELARFEYMRADLPNSWDKVARTAEFVSSFGNCLYLNAVDEASTQIPHTWDPCPLEDTWRNAGGPPMAWSILTGDSAPVGHPLEANTEFSMRQTQWWTRHTIRTRAMGVAASLGNIRRNVPASCLVCHGLGLEAQMWAGLAAGASIFEIWKYDPFTFDSVIEVISSLRDHEPNLHGPPYLPVFRENAIIGRRGDWQWRVGLNSGYVTIEPVPKGKA